MSSEDEESDINKPIEGAGNHKFSKPDFKMILESGSIPDAAMIHAARKRRQKAREQGNFELNFINGKSKIKWKNKIIGDFIPVEDQIKEPVRRGKRLVREENEDDGSDEEERVDMNAITGIKEREERREKFYSVQNECMFVLIKYFRFFSFQYFN